LTGFFAIITYVPHIHTDPGQHDLTAGAYIVRLDKKEPQVLLHMHKKLNKYLQFGGHVELDETPWQTVIHELREESGYEMDQLKLLQPLSRLTKLSGSTLHPLPLVYATYKYGDLDHFHTDTSYGFVTHEPPRHVVDEAESQDIRLFTRNELLNTDEVPDEVREIALYILDTCLKKWERLDAGKVTG